ncbi:methyltransferase family protein [Atopomonas sediminilitoris]|uniref:methyltransferase family protein n=1 Tax=Atopomonas sediminilitoris TaxID=2919919 RepID=UPI001F4DC05D|nr:isoprenylcysteine carboxylmethyltransferase family protein [Atopomonas sediminilitoris]MCJ8170124.1 isoprenylcysteine carboxylmethyltransferase family protein [Atopomonas sediminilitoris]
MRPNESHITLAPPLIYLLFIGLSSLLSVHLPTWPDGQNVWARYIGWGLIDLGVLLIGWAAILMYRYKTTINPFKKPSALLLEGPYRFSRNPIYLGDSLIYLGIGLLLGSLWSLALLPALIICMNEGVIRREERLLNTLFNEPYAAYCRQVRRWL